MTDSNLPSTNPPPAPAGSNSGIRVLVLGIGGAGGNAVNHLAAESLPGMEFGALSTDATALARLALALKVALGSKQSRGLGAGGDPERGRAAAEEDQAGIAALCAGADIIFVVAGLGGGTGTGASPVVARIAKEAGALVLGVVMLPFDCEGTRRGRQAQAGLQELKEAADVVICLPNQKVFRLVDEKTSLIQAFHITNELVAEAVRGIWRLLFRPGLIRVDLADLCAVTQGRHAESCLATAEAQGEFRARELVERLLAHPLIDGGTLLAEAEAVLVTIAGGPSLTLNEVNWIMEQINRQCDQGQLTLGAAIDESLAGRIVVTLVAARRKPRETPSRLVPAEANTAGMGGDLADETLDRSATSRPPSRFVPPPPTLTAQQTEELFSHQHGGGARSRRAASRLKQAQLPLEIISKGRFEKSEPTIHRGQDLDVPTYIRRGVALN